MNPRPLENIIKKFPWKYLTGKEGVYWFEIDLSWGSVIFCFVDHTGGGLFKRALISYKPDEARYYFEHLQEECLRLKEVPHTRNKYFDGRGIRIFGNRFYEVYFGRIEPKKEILPGCFVQYRERTGVTKVVIDSDTSSDSEQIFDLLRLLHRNKRNPITVENNCRKLII